MLPLIAKTLKRIQQIVAQVQRVRGVALWGFGLWLAAVAVPFAFLYPDAGLQQPVCWALALCGPFALLATVLTGEANTVLAAALLGPVPIIVAAPELHGPRTTGPAQAILLVILIFGLLSAAWKSPRADGRTPPPLRGLLHWPSTFIQPLQWLVGVIWLVQAFWVHNLADADIERARATRVAGVAVCWSALRLLPLRGSAPAAQGPRDGWPAYALRRLAWVALFGSLLWLWRRGH